ncbi:MAG: hypothetical protein ACKOI2_13400 [Actinomycetota bacterium]
MRIEVVHDFDAPLESVLVWVSDLSTFPQWTRVLHRVEEEPSPSDSPRAWQVELRGKIGPFARSKRLRMIQVPTSDSGHLRFERRELDGVDHGVWRLDVRVHQGDPLARSNLSAVFEYEGRLWSGAIERLLRDEIEASKQRLTDLVAGSTRL